MCSRAGGGGLCFPLLRRVGRDDFYKNDSRFEKKKKNFDVAFVPWSLTVRGDSNDDDDIGRTLKRAFFAHTWCKTRLVATTLFLSWETQALRSGRVESSTDSIESTLTAIRNVIVGDAVRCAAERNARRSGALRLFLRGAFASR